MKKLFTLFLIAFAAFHASAQISSFPSTEGFESPFQNTGVGAVIYPNWTASEAQYGTRIFSDSLNPRTGGRALAAIPTSGFTATLTVLMDLTGISNMTMNVWAKSLLNGTGDRQAIVYCSTSIDNGTTWSPASQLGDSTSFPNASTNYANYTYVFPFNTNNASNVIFKIEVTRGLGTLGGTAARFIMDDLTFDASGVDVTPPTVLSAKAISTTSVQVNFSEPVNSQATSGSNYLGLGSVINGTQNGIGDQVTIDLATPLNIGQIYNLVVGNVSDLAGNTMTGTQTFPLVFNDNTGLIKFTEIMYNNPGNDSLEFLEIKNMDNHAINIGGWHFSAGVQGFFPSNLTIAAGQRILFAKYPTVVNSFFGVTTYAWDPTSSLNNAGEPVGFSNTMDVVIDSISYGITTPWDSTANGYGHSLVLCNESADEHDGSNWSAAQTFQGMFFGGTTTDSIFANPGVGCTTVGVEEVAFSENKILAYPNPTNDVLNISFVSKVNDSNLFTVLDLSGRVISTTSEMIQAGNNTVQLHLSSLETGTYMVTFNRNGVPTTMRFVKN